jgi:hypothetical protein
LKELQMKQSMNQTGNNRKPPQRVSQQKSERPGEMLSTKAAASYLGFKEATLRGWRLEGVGPPYYVLGAYTQRGVRYHMSDLEQFKSERRCVPSVRHMGKTHAALQKAA